MRDKLESCVGTCNIKARCHGTSTDQLGNAQLRPTKQKFVLLLDCWVQMEQTTIWENGAKGVRIRVLRLLQYQHNQMSLGDHYFLLEVASLGLKQVVCNLRGACGSVTF
ncbi:hypothetical protein HanRHA438_Chr06g0265731 [Helianthus annuus]|uniref:Uncharacterized protein n=1 Tax=Helianthus annuus TaxID=4232 RepID=A0A9K3ISE4_HELAN|nr:hypothetical protein HanXRQr2_Chr06g0256481 [Helianthus annuus]KAJ0573365.1 hypothetical protein HanHA89_Chr06g0225931 [Helianthus annuus]KAJ0737761.1 hypothetical protein HanLR1_Chr06g0210591 [Helianthus annuus]KAJ0740636.1 hypothetical protein HanOQP8_Chr06g0218981 [Helianthus annuus]KAJ0911671.1 hypothetical protein HanRHA438_Chr06g0265731 [Helianthus annuus]